MKQIHSFLPSFRRECGSFMLLFIFLAQLLQAQSVNFQYDPVGNRTGRNVGVQALSSPHMHSDDCGCGQPADTARTGSPLRQGAVKASAAVMTVASIDRNKEVGEIPVSHNMSNGGITYTIPIEIYPGRDGFQPQVSLEYNSLSGNGLAGFGWSVGGLSAITPAHSSHYYDGNGFKPEELSAEGVYTLDGMRLIKQSETTYKSEQGDMVARMQESDTGPGRYYKFTVTLPHGYSSDYGVSLSTTPQVSYPVVLQKDGEGGFIRYSYIQADNNFYVSEITYGCNENVIGKVKFTYAVRTDVNHMYRAGRKISQTRLLKKVEVYHQATLLRTYTLTHNLNDCNFLVKVDCKAGTKEFNPLTFGYGDNEPAMNPHFERGTFFLQRGLSTGAEIIHKMKGGNTTINEGMIIYPHEIVYGVTGTDNRGNQRYGSKYSENQDLLIYRTLDDATLYPEIVKAGTHFNSLIPADVDGDGKDEVLRLRYWYTSADVSTLEVQFHPSSAGTLRTYQLKGTLTEGSLHSPVPRTFLTGDFLGNGRTQILAISGSMGPKGNNVTSWLNLIDPTRAGSIHQAYSMGYDYFNDIIFTADFDGDGRTDVWKIGLNGLYIYSYIGDRFQQIASTNLIKREDLSGAYAKAFLLGDMNGDGKMDLLVSPKKNPYTFGPWSHADVCSGCCRRLDPVDVGESETFKWYACMNPISSCELTRSKIYNSDAYRWTLFTSTGKGMERSYMTLPFTNENNATMVLHDIDGDKLPDIVVKQGSSLRAYLNKNGTFSNTLAASVSIDYRARLLPAVANNYYVSEKHYNRLLGVYGATVATLTYTRDENLQRKLMRSVNSMGTEVAHTYKKMTDRSVYIAVPSATTYPHNVIFMNEYLAAATVVKQAGTTLASTMWQYENGVMHRAGLGFRGFKKITTKDQLRDHQMVQVFEPERFGVPVSADTPTSLAQYYFTVTTDSRKFTKVQMYRKTEFDKLNGVTVESTYSYNNDGDVTREEIKYGEDETVKTENTYTRSHTLSGQTITRTRGGSVWKEETRNTFLPYGSLKPLEVRRYVNGQLQSTARNTWQNGNLAEQSLRMYNRPDSLVNRYTYDNYGRVTRETDAMGLWKEYVYNNKGHLASARDHTSNEVLHTYDDTGRLVKTVYPDGTQQTTTYSWAASGEPGVCKVITQHTGKPTTQVWYDHQGREVKKGVMRFDGTYQYVNNEYDDSGRLKKVSQPYKVAPSQRFTQYSYDRYDRITQQQEPTGKVVTYSYPPGQVVTRENGNTTTRTYDAAGKLMTVNGPDGRITYQSRADGQTAFVVLPGDIRIGYEYDTFGRKIKMTDPAFGVTRYVYNTAGNLAEQIDADNKTTRYEYDRFDRMVTTILPEMTLRYEYDDDNRLVRQTASNGTSVTYTYDDLSRLQKAKEEGPDSKWLEKVFTYSNGHISAIRYTTPGGTIGTENHIYTNGYLTEQKLGTTSFFKLTAENTLGLPVTVQTGGITRQYGYDEYGLITSRRAAAGNTGIQHFGYEFDREKGNLDKRTDQLRSKTELFAYDPLNRLTAFGGQTVTYDGNGNILHKSNAGRLGYNLPDKPYAADRIEEPTANIPARPQQVSYYSFKRPHTITENGYVATFVYNGALDRVKMRVEKNGREELTRYYLGACYETDTRDGRNLKEKLYIGGNYYTAPAVYVKEESGSWQLYNICRDHLGSITHITTDSGSSVKQELSYDAWGSMRNPANHTLYETDAQPDLFLGRGYTGHEHLPWFGLINMNARLYDPVPGRFLSPDPYVQAPDFLQNYNRYSYCMNNPLVYTDPSGEIFFFINFFKDLYINTFIKPWKQGINAWTKSENWHSTTMAWKIDMGLLKGNAKQIVARFNWGPFSTALGLTANHIHNTFYGVKSVSYYGGATAVETYSERWGGITLGSYITGSRGLRADPHNSLFQHEYGHYLQNLKMGPGYLFRVGIPSLWDTIFGEDGKHSFHKVEQDANLRAFNYFNKNVDGFYKTAEEYELIKGEDQKEGWNFAKNPLDPYGTKISGDYWDYKNYDHRNAINSLGMKTPFYNLIKPLETIVGRLDYVGRMGNVGSIGSYFYY